LEDYSLWYEEGAGWDEGALSDQVVGVVWVIGGEIGFLALKRLARDEFDYC